MMCQKALAILVLVAAALLNNICGKSYLSSTNESDDQIAQCEKEHSNCTECYITLVKSLMYNDENVYNLQRVFLPPTKETPVFVIVNYNFSDAGNKTWYWTEETSLLLHPIAGFQFFSLFFGNYQWRVSELNITLSSDCYGTREDYLELLTERLEVHAFSVSITPELWDAESAYSADLNTLKKMIYQNNLTAILWLYQIVIPMVFTICAEYMIRSSLKSLDRILPINEMAGSATSSSINNDSNTGGSREHLAPRKRLNSDLLNRHATVFSIAALSTLLCLFAISMDICGIIYANLRVKDAVRKFSMVDHHDSPISAIFVLPLLMLILYDVIALVRHSIFLLWEVFRKNNSVFDLVATSLVTTIFVLSNHSYYIVIAFINDPVHANSIAIYSAATVIVYLLAFSSMWKKCFKKGEESEREGENHTRRRANCKACCQKVCQWIRNIDRPYKQILITVVLAVVLVPLQVLITATFVHLPIKTSLDDVPIQIQSIYESLLVVFGALITYQFLVKRNRSLDAIIKRTLIKHSKKKRNKDDDLSDPFAKEERIKEVVTGLIEIVESYKKPS